VISISHTKTDPNETELSVRGFMSPIIIDSSLQVAVGIPYQPYRLSLCAHYERTSPYMNANTLAFHGRIFGRSKLLPYSMKPVLFSGSLFGYMQSHETVDDGDQTWNGYESLSVLLENRGSFFSLSYRR